LLRKRGIEAWFWLRAQCRQVREQESLEGK